MTTLARLFAILGAATLIGLLVFSRDTKLAGQGQAAGVAASQPANADALSPTIQSLAETPAPAAEAPKAEAPKP